MLVESVPSGVGVVLGLPGAFRRRWDRVFAALGHVTKSISVDKVGAAVLTPNMNVVELRQERIIASTSNHIITGTTETPKLHSQCVRRDE